MIFFVPVLAVVAIMKCGSLTLVSRCRDSYLGGSRSSNIASYREWPCPTIAIAVSKDRMDEFQ